MSEGTLLYEKIINYLKEEINSGALKPGSKLPTEIALAERFGVSRITSKRAFEDLRAEGLIYRVRGSGSFVTEKKNITQSQIINGNSSINHRKVISLVFPMDTYCGGFMNVVAGASKVLDGTDYLLSIHCSNMRVEEEKELLMQLYNKRVGGIIYYPISDNKNIEIVNKFYLDNYPIVSIDKYFDSVPLSYVVSDNLKGAYEATKHLIKLGHQKIAFLSDNKIDDATSVRNRYFGYCKAMKEYGILIDERMVKNGDFAGLNEEKAGEILRELMDMGMTAACTINDYIASFVIKTLNELGYNVPKDVSVTGFDDLDFANLLSVPLTTVRQDLVQVGQIAMEYILDVIENGNQQRLQKVIPTQLISRNSTKELVKENITV